MSSPAASVPGGVPDASIEALVPCLGSLSLTNSTTVAEAKLKVDEVKHEEPFQERNISEEDKKLIGEVRSRVLEMLKDPTKLAVTKDEFPTGMGVHWTTWWPEGDPALKKDTISAQDSDPEKAPNLWADHILHRFLLARERKVEKAAKMYFHFIKWRVTWGAAHLGTFDRSPLESLFNSIICHSYHGWDKHGRPMYIQKSGIFDPNRFASEVSVEQAAIGHTWFTMEIIKRCEIASKRLNRRVDTIVNIIDMKGMGLAHRKSLKFFKTTSYIDQNFSPEMLGCLYMINCPSWFPSIFALAKPFLAPATQAKIRILGTKFQDVLINDLGREGLPVEYGGLCQCPAEVGGCVPLPTGPRERKNDGEDIEEEEFTVKAGKKHELEMPVTGQGEEVWWSYDLHSKDIDFSVEFRPTHRTESVVAESAAAGTSGDNSASNSTVIQAVQRIAHASNPNYGSCTPPVGVPGVLHLIFSNEYSRWNSKSVKVKMGVRKPKAAESTAEGESAASTSS